MLSQLPAALLGTLRYTRITRKSSVNMHAHSMARTKDEEDRAMAAAIAASLGAPPAAIHPSQTPSRTHVNKVKAKFTVRGTWSFELE